MKKKIALKDFIVYFIFLTAITLNVTDATFKFMQLDYKITTILIITSAALLYMWASINYRFAFLLIIIPIVVFNPSRIFSYIIYMVGNFLDFVRVMFFSTVLPEKYYGIYFTFVYITLVLALMVIFYFVVIKQNTSILLILGSVLYVTYYFLGTNNLDKSCSTFLALCIIFYAYNEYMKRKNHWSSNDTEVRKNYFYRWISLTVILVVITNFLTQALKYDIEPLSFEWFENNVISKFEDITSRGRDVTEASLSSQFKLSQTGYQQDPKRLGGPIEDDESLAFRLTTADETVNLHLRGNVLDKYNGASWGKVSTDSRKLKEPMGFQRNTNVTDKVSYALKSLMISPEKTITTTAFNPLYPYYVSNSWGYYFAGTEDELFNPKSVKRGKSYKVEYNDYDVEEMQILLNELGNEAEAKVPGDIDSRYFEVPASVPDRVEDLTRSIISKYKTPFEKASAIEIYLKNEYKYDKDTSVLPDNKDFVDYFLFEEKKGYCTYFASAMAVMGRIAGLPTRYVEGYALPGSLQEDRIVDVLNSDAHAWVEVYFNEVGWITFDPTPGMSSIGLLPKQDETPGGENGGEEPVTPPGRENPQKPGTPVEELPQEQLPEEGVYEDAVKPVYIIAAMIIMLLMAVFVVLLNLASFKKKKFLAYSMEKLKIYGSFVGTNYENGLTIREYIYRLSKGLNTNFEEYIRVYEGNLYGGRNTSTEDIRKINKLLRVVRKDILNREGKLKFYAYNSFKTFLIPFKYKEGR